MCRCGRGFFNPNGINFVVNAQAETPIVMHFKSQTLNVRVDNAVATIEI